jgi:octanoyl-[GcvH]:protein N-octanoyltransferase
MNLLLPDRFDDPGTGYAYTRTIFEEVAGGGRYGDRRGPRPGRHVGVTRRDTLRPGFDEAVRAAYEEDYPVLVRAAGGGAIAAGRGTFGFSIVRPAEDTRRDPRKRYDEAAALVLGAFSRLGVDAGVGEVRGEFCPGDHSIRIGDFESGTKVVGIAQRITRKATSVGGIVLVHGEKTWSESSLASTTP